MSYQTAEKKNTMKIYNEIVIDMNPESPTFEETLYEDSFEYSGDMMLAQYSADQFNEGDYIFPNIAANDFLLLPPSESPFLLK